MNFIKHFPENIPVLGVNYRLDRRTDHFNIVLVKNSGLIKLHPAVEGGLPAKSQQDALRLLLFYHLLHKKGSNRQKINFIRNFFRGLNGGNIRIDEYRFHAFLFQRFQRLGAGVVKFASFSDF